MTELSFVVYGIPRPQGSLRPVTNRKTGKTLLVPQLKGVTKWKELVAKEAWAAACAPTAAALANHKMISGAVPVELEVRFHLPKPKKAAHPWPRADLDKLVRAIGDALTGVVYKDDSQIVRVFATKDYAHVKESQGAEIRVKALA